MKDGHYDVSDASTACGQRNTDVRNDSMSHVRCEPVLEVNCIESNRHLLSLANDLELFYAARAFYVTGICSSFLSKHCYVRLVTPARIVDRLVMALL